MPFKITEVDKQNSGIVYTGNWTGLPIGTEIQLENASNNSSTGSGTFGENISDNSKGNILVNGTGASATNLVEGIDYNYDEYLDTSTGGVNIYDTNISGSLDTGKYFRIVENGKNIVDGTGLDLRVVAKNLSVDTTSPIDECWVDPELGKFILPRPNYFSRCETTNSLIAPDISTGTPTIERSDNIITTSGKFGSAVAVEVYSSDTQYFYPLTDSFSSDKGTVSMWFRNDSLFSSVALRIYLNETTFVQLYDIHTTGTQAIYINGSSVSTSSYSLDAGTGWHHVYIMWDTDKSISGTNSIEVWMDGTSRMSTTDSITVDRLKWNFEEFGAHGNAYIMLDNIKIWDHLVSSNDSWEYNSGIGRENALHTIYSSSNEYAPILDDSSTPDSGVGYYYIPSSTSPASLVVPTGSGNEEIQLEDVTDYDFGFGRFGTGIGKFISSGPLVLSSFIENNDFYYDEELDGTGTHTIDLYDDSDSGALDGASGKHFRIVHDGENVTKTSGGTLNLGLTPVAKNLSNANQSPPSDEVWIDPIRSRFILPKPIYWSKCESENNLYVADIGFGTNILGSVFSVSSSGKFNNAIEEYSSINGFSHIYNITTFTTTTNKCVLSFYLNRNNNKGGMKIDFGSVTFDLYRDTTNYYYNGSLFTQTIESGVVEGYNHYYIVIDGSGGLDSSKTFRVFRNGTEVIYSSTIFDNFSICQLSFGSYGEGGGGLLIDNIKIWNHIVSEDPSFEYNSGTGRENALHEIYGSANNYEPKLTSTDSGGVGYYKLDNYKSKVKWTL